MKNKSKEVIAKYLQTKIENIDIYIFVLKSKDLIKISYVSERGIKEEKASVQRIFNPKRVEDISDYVSRGEGFFSPFIINWNNGKDKINFKKNEIEIPLISQSAQLLDGQHRFRGIQRAIELKKNKGEENVIVVMTNNIETKDAANIFTKINSKQQSVSKSLIYDLFKELEDDPEHEIIRSSDIARYLNTEEDSPYFNKIVFPGSVGGKGTIQLSVVIDSLKDHVKKNSSFDKKNISSLNIQQKTISNFFEAIKLAYNEIDLWNNSSKNPFLGAAGFRAGIDVLVNTLLDKAQGEKSLKVDFFKKILDLNNKNLLLKDDKSFKELGGKEQVKHIIEFLKESIQSKQGIPQESDYDI